MTQQLLLNLPDQLYQQLLKKAQIQGETLENLAIKCLNNIEIPPENDPLDSFIGAFDSKGSDWLEKHDFYLGKSTIESTLVVSEVELND